jgi:tetratricopeptide (TPR) repeat protein
MRRLFLLCALLPLTAVASEHWIRFTSGPIEVFSSAGSKDGRETLVKFEEFRHALGYVLGDNDLQMPLPIRILLFKTGAPRIPEPVVRGRDQYNVVLTAGQAIPNEVFARLTQLFLDTNTARMPERLERGLVALFSTIQVTGIRITLGEPPLHPDMDWARVHLLAVDPEYYGKLRVLTYNLRKGVDEDAAFRNAVGKSPEQIELQAQLHLAEGRFQATSISPLPMSPQDFPERSVEPAAAQLAIADLLLGDASRAIYRDLIAQKTRVPEAWEGLGMLALHDQQTDEARKDFAAAMEAGAKSAECYMEYARLETDNAKALAALEHAAKINPKLAEPHFLMAQRQTEPLKRIQELKLAAKLDARNLAYWQALAEAYLDAHDFPQAAQAWKSAEQAASTPGDRARMQRQRLDVEAQRLDWEDAEKKRKAGEEARELERLKQQARADLHALETRANERASQGQPPRSPNEKVVPWWDGPQPSGVARGVLKQVDCLGKRLRLVVQDDDQKTVKLLIADPAQVAVLGGAGELKLSCGAQGLRRVKVEYFPKANAKLATKGEVATIEFQ